MSRRRVDWADIIEELDEPMTPAEVRERLKYSNISENDKRKISIEEVVVYLLAGGCSILILSIIAGIVIGFIGYIFG